MSLSVSLSSCLRRVATLYAKLAAFKSGQSRQSSSRGTRYPLLLCHSLLIATFVGFFWQHRVLLTHSVSRPLALTLVLMPLVSSAQTTIRSRQPCPQSRLQVLQSSVIQLRKRRTSGQQSTLKWTGRNSGLGEVQNGRQRVGSKGSPGAELVPLNCFQNKLPVDRLCGLAQKKRTEQSIKKFIAHHKVQRV